MKSSTAASQETHTAPQNQSAKEKKPKGPPSWMVEGEAFGFARMLGRVAIEKVHADSAATHFESRMAMANN